jgi:hypothetical protein
MDKIGSEKERLYRRFGRKGKVNVVTTTPAPTYDALLRFTGGR